MDKKYDELKLMIDEHMFINYNSPNDSPNDSPPDEPDKEESSQNETEELIEKDEDDFPLNLFTRQRSNTTLLTREITLSSILDNISENDHQQWFKRLYKKIEMKTNGYSGFEDNYEDDNIWMIVAFLLKASIIMKKSPLLGMVPNSALLFVCINDSKVRSLLDEPSEKILKEMENICIKHAKTLSLEMLNNEELIPVYKADNVSNDIIQKMFTYDYYPVYYRVTTYNKLKIFLKKKMDKQRKASIKKVAPGIDDKTLDQIFRIAKS